VTQEWLIFGYQRVPGLRVDLGQTLQALQRHHHPHSSWCESLASIAYRCALHTFNSTMALWIKGPQRFGIVTDMPSLCHCLVINHRDTGACF
jgi:hypothetical protein